MNFVQVLKECEGAAGAGTKKIIQSALAKLDPISRVLAYYAQNPYLVFGVRQFDRPLVYAEVDPTDDQITGIIQVLDDLATRRVTGDAARFRVTTMLAAFTEETASYLERIIDKDLKGGFSADTYNKIWKDEQVPTFEVMLADKCEDTDDFEKHVTFPCLAEQKLDGERTIAIVKTDSITYYSRSGKEAKHVDGLFDEDLRALHGKVGYDFILDGERYASNFTETMNAKKTGNNEAKANLRFYAFFMMSLTDWVEQKTFITMRQNRAYLELVLKDCKKISVTVGREVTDYQDMMTYCNEAIDIHKVEGLILKDYNSPYTWDRSFSWTKCKRFYDVDCKIVGFYNGRPKSRLENTLGGIEVVGFLEDGTRVEARVGSGFSDELRAEIWQNQAKWLDKPAVVIKYQEVSRAKNKAVASLRFPTFERERDDKLVEI